MEKDKIQAQKEIEDRKDKLERDRWAHEREIIILKEEERRKTEIEKAAITGLSFNPEVDQDNDGTPDFLEVAKFGVDANIKARKQDLEEDKQKLKEKEFTHNKEVDKEKLAIDRQKAQNKSTK